MKLLHFYIQIHEPTVPADLLHTGTVSDHVEQSLFCLSICNVSI